MLKKNKESSKTVQDMLDVCALIVADPPFINLSSTYMNMKNGKPKEAIIEHEETHLRNHSLNPIYIDENSALSGDALRTMLRIWTKKDKKQREIVNKLIDKYNKDIKDKNSPTYKRWKNRKVLEDYTDITNMNYHQNIDEFEADIGAALKTSKRALLKGVKYLSKKSLQDGYIKNLREVNMLLILMVTGQANVKLSSGANTFAALLQMRANLKHAIKTARGFTKTELKARKRAMNEWKVDKSLYEEALRDDYYREYDIQDYVDAIECDNLSKPE